LHRIQWISFIASPAPHRRFSTAQQCARFSAPYSVQHIRYSRSGCIRSSSTFSSLNRPD